MIRSATIWVLILSLFSCSGPVTPEPSEAVSMKTATFEVEGMVCEVGCAKLIEKTLAGVSGVSVATIDYEKGTATVLFDESHVKGEDLLKTVTDINDHQYHVSGLQVHASDVKSEMPKSGTREEPGVSLQPIVFPDVFRNLSRLF